ncbi:MAG: ankyrin repeat domain-containing protein [Acidimicrobiales bacterium]
MSSDEVSPGPVLILPHGDPVAGELVTAIRGGDLTSLKRLVADRPELASARMIGRNGSEGGWRTALHVTADWPGYFPAAPDSVLRLLLSAGADPNDDTGGDRPETPLQWAASTDDLEVAEALIGGGARLNTPGGSIGTPLDNAVGYGCWHVARLLVDSGATVAKPWHAAALGLIDPLVELLGDDPEPETLSQPFWQRAPGRNAAPPSTCSAAAQTPTGCPTTPMAHPWTRRAAPAPDERT